MISMTIKGTEPSRRDYDEYIRVRTKAFKTFDFEKISQCMQLYGNKKPENTPEFWVNVAMVVLENKPTPHQRAEAHRILDELNEKY